MQPKHRRLIGLSVWLVACLGMLFGPFREGRKLVLEASAIHPLFSNDQEIQVEDTLALSKMRMPVFCQRNGVWHQAGIVTRVPDSSASFCTIHWYGVNEADAEQDFVVYRSGGQLSEVVATLLPPHKRDQISERLSVTFQQYGNEFINDLVPLVQQTLSRAVPEIENGLKESISRHRSEINDLLDRWNLEYVQPELIPLARQELLPIVRLHAQPVAESIGRELWDRASLWRFGWRAAYDKVPLPKRNLVQQEWDRFVEEDAVPVLESHTDEIVTAIQRTLGEITANQVIREQLAVGITQLAKDQPTRDLIQTLIRESVIENEPLRLALEEIWTSDLARKMMSKNSDRLEPVIRQIGEDLIGSEESGINPDFARVLRNQILGKDRTWMVAVPSQESGSARVRPANQWMPYPLVYTTSAKQKDDE